VHSKQVVLSELIALIMPSKDKAGAPNDIALRRVMLFGGCINIVVAAKMIVSPEGFFILLTLFARLCERPEAGEAALPSSAPVHQKKELGYAICRDHNLSISVKP
jgi:hypothetical protein